MSSDNSNDIPCYSCYFTARWADILNLIQDDNILEADNPQLALMEALGANRLCCRGIMFNQRVADALRQALINKRATDVYSEIAGDEQKFSQL